MGCDGMGWMKKCDDDDDDEDEHIHMVRQGRATQDLNPPWELSVLNKLAPHPNTHTRGGESKKTKMKRLVDGTRERGEETSGELRMLGTVWPDGVNTVEATGGEWEEIEMAVDSGATDGDRRGTAERSSVERGRSLQKRSKIRSGGRHPNQFVAVGE
jgi:hypothetical protein